MNTYRIADSVTHTHSNVPPSMCVRCMIDLHIDDGELILDTRLQAIADAWNENLWPSITIDIETYWPELFNLLDALEGTDDE